MQLKKALTVTGIFFFAVFIVRTELRIDTLEKQVRDINEVIYTPDTIKYTKSDLECLAKNVYYEAGNQDDLGKIAVAQITVNRVKTGFWGENICKVVYSKAQFSWTLHKKLPKPDPERYAESMRVAYHVLHGQRIKGLDHGLYYHADYINTPKWVDPTQYVTKIGQHIFYNKAKNSWIEI